VVAGVVVLLLAGADARAQDKKDKGGQGEIPKAVMGALKARFPKAAIDKWTKAKEGDDIVYDIEFKQDGRRFEADITEKGTLLNYETEIPAKDLPQAVRKAVDAKYPKATLKVVMESRAVSGKNEKLDGYEITLVTAGGQDVEVTIAPDGKITEDSGSKKAEKK
jgi:hypothetical protein